MNYWATLARALCVIAVSGCALAEETGAKYVSRDLPLESLVDCALRTKWIGFWPRLTEGVMLTCEHSEFLVLQPNNLLGHVRIDTPDEALAYVRVFTSPETYAFFDLEGMVEIVEGDTTSADATFNMVSPRVFKKRFQPARVREVDQHQCKPGVTFACGREYEIRRVVVLLDQRVYEVIESVYESGFYALVSKRLLLKDASKVGVLHFGNL